MHRTETRRNHSEFNRSRSRLILPPTLACTDEPPDDGHAKEIEVILPAKPPELTTAAAQPARPAPRSR